MGYSVNQTKIIPADIMKKIFGLVSYTAYHHPGHAPLAIATMARFSGFATQAWVDTQPSTMTAPEWIRAAIDSGMQVSA